jgi:thioredoxin-like negative regulator of GroEL
MDFLKDLTKTQILLIILAFVILLNIVLSYCITPSLKKRTIVNKPAKVQSSKESIMHKKTEQMTTIPTVKGYFASWCHNCTNMKDEWEKFMNEANENKTAKVTEVYCDKNNNKQKCQNDGIGGFPTINVTKNGTTKEYQGRRTAKALHQFVKNM